MGKFLRRVSLFMILVCIVLTFVELFFLYVLRRPQIYQLDSAIETIIVGDSHTQCALDDSIISKTVNISNSLDSYLYSYIKIRKLLLYNKNLKVVMLGFSWHNLQEHSMEDWYYKEEFLSYKTAQYLQLMDWDEVRFLGKRNPISLFEGIIQFPVSKFDAIRKSDTKTAITDIDFGGSTRLPNLLADWKKPLNWEKGKNQDSTVSKDQLHYLAKIAALCKHHQVELVLFTAPLHKLYPRRNSLLTTTYHDKIIPSLKWWDYSNFELPDAYYADPEHLNKDGSAFFSTLVQEKMNSEL